MVVLRVDWENGTATIGPPGGEHYVALGPQHIQLLRDIVKMLTPQQPKLRGL
jgi:hypothetical protein